MRCPICHEEFIPDEVKSEWLRKWNTGFKPHHKEPCKICGKAFGLHHGTECPTTKDSH